MLDRAVRWAVVLLVVGAAVAQDAAAQLSEVDLVPGSGDAAVSFDAATGLYWLDLTRTQDLSVPAIQGGAGGWVDAGWRYATADEICALFANYAVAVPVCGGVQSGTAAGDQLAALQGFVGVTIETASNRISSGFYEDLDGDPTRVGLGRLMYQIPPDTSYTLVQTSAVPAVPVVGVGSWLVSDTPPVRPVPVFPFRVAPLSGVVSTLALVGVAALAWAARRHRRAAAIFCPERPHAGGARCAIG